MLTTLPLVTSTSPRTLLREAIKPGSRLVLAIQKSKWERSGADPC